MTPDDTSPNLTKGERTEQRIIAAARLRFGADSYAAVSVSKVARDCHLTPAAVYAYFPNKESLYRSAVDHELTDWVAVAAPDAAGDRPMLAMFMSLLSSLDDHQLIARTLREGEPDDVRRILNSEPMRGMRASIEAAIAARQQSGATSSEFPAGDLAIGMETLVFSLFVTAVRLGSFADPDRVNGLLAVFQSALGHPDGVVPTFTTDHP